jgi:hypothetical protein
MKSYKRKWRFGTSTEVEVLNFVGNRIPIFQPVTTTGDGKSEISW